MDTTTESARIVIIGAGIVGCSIAYHLTQLGWRDIVVLDKGPLYETGGSTSHAPGLMFQINPSKFLTQCARYSIELFSKLQFRGEQCLYQVGGSEIALSDERWQELKRRYTIAHSYGISAELISGHDLQKMVPILNPAGIKGVLHVPTDSDVRGWFVAGAMAEQAIASGAARFYGNLEAMELILDEDTKTINGVNTATHTFRADQVVLATNVWANVLAKKVGLSFPIFGAQHLYAITDPVPELAADKDLFIKHPILRHQDYFLYYRQHGDAYGVGNYGHTSLLVEPEQIGAKAEGPFTPEHHEAGKKGMDDLFPSLAALPYQKSFNGYMPFTCDGMPLMGQTSIGGLSTCLGVWVTHSGGVGKTMAEWLDSQTSEYAWHEADLRRLQPHSTSKLWSRARVDRQYQEVYYILHPHDPPLRPRNIRRSPFTHLQEKLGAVWHPRADWETADWFNSNESLLQRYQGKTKIRSGWEAQHWSPIQGAEHLALREGVGLYDISNFAKFEVSGAGATAFLERVCVNRIRPVGKITYTTLCDEGGGIQADLTITRMDKNEYMILTGGGTRFIDLGWLRSHLPSDGTVILTDCTSAWSGIGLWGPKARAVLQKLADADVSNAAFPYFSYQEFCIGVVPVRACRLSYTGELGWELYCPSEYGLTLWELLWEAGAQHGIFPLGAGAFNSLRLEKGYRAIGQELSSDYNPFEAGLGWTVRLDKPDFIGKNALMAIKERGIERTLCCLTSTDPQAMALGKEPIFAAGAQRSYSTADSDPAIGYVAAADYGYSVGKFVFYAYLPPSHAAQGTELEIAYFDRRFPAVVAADPQFDADMSHLKA